MDIELIDIDEEKVKAFKTKIEEMLVLMCSTEVNYDYDNRWNALTMNSSVHLLMRGKVCLKILLI